MRKLLLCLTLAVIAGVAFAVAVPTSGPVSATTTDASAPAAGDTAEMAVDVCSDPPQPGYARCLSMAHAGGRHKSVATETPNGSTGLPVGYGPADLQSAYNLTAAIKAGAGTGQTVALVDAFDDPTAEADLAVYRSTYGLPPCTTDNGCFRKVNQDGAATPLPRVDGSWSVEISLDLQTVSAACPACRILLVEGNSAAATDLGAAEDTAANLGANAISNSYAVAESELVLTLAAHYDHPGVAITAASGDTGYRLVAPFPADLSTVTAVGGTSLSPAKGKRGWSEATWTFTAQHPGAGGSSCSTLVDKPSWQGDGKECAGRVVADVSADADPATGYAVYDTTPNQLGLSGWMVIGGTSGASPLIAGVYALAGHTASVHDSSGLYAHGKQFNDVVSGNNSVPGSAQECPTTATLCTAGPGYDGPTGLGTPNGPGAF